MNERDCIRTLTVWTCEFARQNLAAWPLSTTDSMNRSHENNNSIASHCAMVWWLQVLDQGPATRWDVAANNGTCRSRLSGSSGGLRKTCMCKTACGQQWESAFDSDCSGVQLLSQLTYISLPSSNTHNTSLRHTSPRYWNADQSLQHSSAEHLLHISAHLDRQASLTCRFAVGIEFPSLPDFASLQNLHSTTNLSRTLTSPTHHQTHHKHIIKMEYNTGAPTGGRACYNCELLARNPSLAWRALPAASSAQSFAACARLLPRALCRGLSRVSSQHTITTLSMNLH